MPTKLAYMPQLSGPAMVDTRQVQCIVNPRVPNLTTSRGGYVAYRAEETDRNILGRGREGGGLRRCSISHHQLLIMGV